jgi:hypothetical protein
MVRTAALLHPGDRNTGVETFAQHIIKATTIDALKFLHDESFELRDRFPDEVACMANAHALEENTRAVIDPLISNKEACFISISGYGAGPDQIFLDSPKAEWLPPPRMSRLPSADLHRH